MPEKECRSCSEMFKPLSGNTFYCKSDECQKQRRKHHLRLRQNHAMKRKFGVTVEQFTAMSEYQDHKCKICGEEETALSNQGNGEVKRLSIDHDHDTGQIRGLLCNKCNTGLGGFQDNVETLQRAILYLEGSKNSTVYIPKK